MELNELPEVFESRIRIAVLAILCKEKTKNFIELKRLTGAADGNLSVHLRRLEEAGYISIEKSFLNLRPQTSYTITREGNEKFREYILLLERLITDTP